MAQNIVCYLSPDCLAYVAGIPVVDSPEDPGIVDFRQGSGEAGEGTRHAGQPTGINGKFCVVPEERREHTRRCAAHNGVELTDIPDEQALR